MADNDPFAEPDDSDRTLIKPNPGGRLTPSAPAAAPRPAQAAPPAPAGPAGALVETGMNPLNAAATTLFSLISRIGNRAQHMDPGKLRNAVVSEIRGFETRAMQSGIDPQDVKVARYAICATVDDVVQNTPWGGDAIWAQQSMVGTFHRENVGGDRFFDVLARLEQQPGKSLNMLEFLYMCLSLGFEGRLRVADGGADKHMEIRSGLARIIRTQRGEVERDLSPHWHGLDKPHRALSLWKPVWITAGLVGAALIAGFLTLSWMLSGKTERVLGQLSTLDTGQVATLFRRAPPPPAPVLTVTQLEEVKGFLQDEIAAGIVTVFQDANTITVRISGSGQFGSGSDQLQKAYLGPLGNIATALNDQEGPVLVVGHSDNIPVGASNRFGSNTALSLARAESVMRTLGAQLNDPGRLVAEGRAEKDPIASNETREGRALNRRIEIVLIRKEAI